MIAIDCALKKLLCKIFSDGFLIEVFLNILNEIQVDILRVICNPVLEPLGLMKFRYQFSISKWKRPIATIDQVDKSLFTVFIGATSHS